VAALIVACVAALVVTQRTRRSGLVVDQIQLTKKFSPDGDAFGDAAAITFRVKGDDVIQLDVMRRSRQIRRLAVDQEVPDGEPVSFVWDGLDDSGQVAPPGRYRIRIELEDRDRVIAPGEKMILLGAPSIGVAP
jgi:hypothetical protein